MKKITITAVDQFTEELFKTPLPAIKSLPKWFKEMPSTANNEKIDHWIVNEGPNFTMKKCIPLRDALTIGYYLTTPADLSVKRTINGPAITWGSDIKILETQNSISAKQFPVPKEYNSQIIFKWVNAFVINTPKGYSTFFSHPVLEIDLPFFSLSGFVDTDVYNLPINFPFVIRDDFEGIIPAGTPFIQFYPIKRDVWSIERKKHLTKIEEQKRLNYLRHKFSGYKMLFWQRKEYK
jgi:hypothetical protein